MLQRRDWRKRILRQERVSFPLRRRTKTYRRYFYRMPISTISTMGPPAIFKNDRANDPGRIATISPWRRLLVLRMARRAAPGAAAARLDTGPAHCALEIGEPRPERY